MRTPSNKTERLEMREQIYNLGPAEGFKGMVILRGKTVKGEPVVKIWYGSELDPKENVRFKDRERRETFIWECKQNHIERQKRKEERKTTQQTPHPFKLGDIFVCSWGYDQTNVDYYQITRVSGKSVYIRGIMAETTEETGYMQGRCKPVKDGFLENSKEQRKVPQTYDGKYFYLSMTSYSSASLWDGTENRWSSYA